MKNLQVIIGSQYRSNYTGWEIRYLGLLNELYKYFNIFIFAPGNTKPFAKLFPKAYVCNSSSEAPVYNNKKTKYIREMILVSRYNLIRYFYNYNKNFHEIILKDNIDYDCTFFFGLESYLYYGAACTSNIIFCDICDSNLRKVTNAIQNSEKLIYKFLYYMDYIYYKRLKKKYITENIRLLAITNLDVRYISKVLNNNIIHCIPNGVNQYINKINEELIYKKHNSKSIIFTGSLNYGPNIESILYILEEIWPSIVEGFPNYNFKIIGRSPVDVIRTKVQNSFNVDLIGPVPNLFPYYMEARLFLGPIILGGGMKNKFLESFASGTPIVTNKEGAEGIEFINKKHGYICHTKYELINAVKTILEFNYKEYSMLAKNCFDLSKKYKWENVGCKLSQLIQKEILHQSQN